MLTLEGGKRFLKEDAKGCIECSLGHGECLLGLILVFAANAVVQMISLQKGLASKA